MQKIFMKTSIAALTILVGSSAFAMSRIGEIDEAWEAPLKVAISNQTNSNIFIELEGGGKVIIVPPYTADTWFEVLPTYMEGGFARRPLAAQYPVEIQTKQGKFDLKWVVGAYADRGTGQLNLNKKDGDECIYLAKPRNPIIIFGQTPIIKERDEKPMGMSNDEAEARPLMSIPMRGEAIEESALVVEISNQTKNAITIEQEGIGKIDVPSFANTSFKLKPLPPAGSGDISKDIVKIAMNNEQYYVSWAVFMHTGKGAGKLSLYKEKPFGVFFLHKPHNPIIIFEEGKAFPTVKERENK